MMPTTASERVLPWDEWAAAPAATGYSLNMVFVSQDGPTRKWAREIFERVAKVAGHESARATWWRVADLSEPGVLAGAVSTAMRADVIVIAIRAGEGLPLPFYVWVNAWLPHRKPATGALVALLGASSCPGPHLERIREYLQIVAQQGRLDFLPETRELADDPAEPSPQPRANGASLISVLTRKQVPRARR